MNPMTSSTQRLSWQFQDNSFLFNNNKQSNDHSNNINPELSSDSFMIAKTHSNDGGARIGVYSSDFLLMPPNFDDFGESIRSLRPTMAETGSQIHTINGLLANSIGSTSENYVDSASNPHQFYVGSSFDINMTNTTSKAVDYGQPDLKSWCVSNPVHLTEMYRNDEVNPSKICIDPDVNLANHYPEMGDFVQKSGIEPLNIYSFDKHTIGLQSTTTSLWSNQLEVDSSLDFSVTNISNDIWKAPANAQDIQPDLKSWDAFNPKHLNDMYRSNNKSPSQIGAGPDITLPNHSTDTSAFVPYSRTKQLNLVQPLQATTDPQLTNDFFENGDEEDLFYSDLTHFKPIENFVEVEPNYVDGHTFNINNELDTLEFERTSSGILRYKSQEYLEYTCNDVDISNEEESTISANHLKSEVLVIKFPLKHSGEIACQTDKEDDIQLVFDRDETQEKDEDEDCNRLSGSGKNSHRKGYCCGFKHLYKLLLKAFSGCCLRQKSIKKERN